MDGAPFWRNQKEDRNKENFAPVWKGGLKLMFSRIKAARRAAHQLRAQRSGSQLERRSKGAGG